MLKTNDNMYSYYFFIFFNFTYLFKSKNHNKAIKILKIYQQILIEIFENVNSLASFILLKNSSFQAFRCFNKDFYLKGITSKILVFDPQILLKYTIHPET